MLELYDRLHRGQTIRASTIAEAMGVDRRTLQRDLAVLREVLGPRLEDVEQPEIGWRLAHSQRRWGTTRWQLLGVALGARMMGFLSGRSFDGQVGPLLSELRRSLAAGQALDVADLEQKLFVVESGTKLYRTNPDLLLKLEEMVDGLLLQHPIEVLYLSPRSEAAGRPPRALRVQALCMTIHRGAVYFVVEILGGDWVGAGRILLALDRFQTVKVDRDAERRPHPRDFRAAEFFGSAFGIWRGDERHLVQLRVSQDYAAAVRERSWHPSQRLEELPDGSLRLTMTLGHLGEVADWVLGMGEHAVAEAPPALVSLIRERLGAALAQYP
ncbi:MAG: WYL domain-containing protein [Myxococcota bacterium]